MNFLSPPLAEYRPLIATVALSAPYHTRPDPLTPILEQADSPDPASKIVLSCSSADSLGVSSADSAIHFVDGASGTVISRVQRASGSRISAEQFVLEPSSLTSSLSLHIGSPPSCAATDIDAHVDSLPSFMLTLPTPVSPQSHVFSPETHFTTAKVLDTAEAGAPGDCVPSLPCCDHLQGGKLCRACEAQMLACIWFQNTDAGAQALSPEHPAQSSTRTRTVRASMGVGASSSGVGLGLTEYWDEGNDVQDDEDDIEDPGSLAIEAPPPPKSSSLALLSQRVNTILHKARAGLRLLFPSLLTSPLGNTHHKPA
ncbi:hypothetical protein EI94DRAFT_851950 [Lactarius quietus]|nr:hypothetical protein EI94DRAFT_851950 [Lactarius quietus]